MKDKLNITIRIADQTSIPLQISREDEEVVRTAEYNVNKLWQSWMQRYRDMSSSRVLAMVAFQFAKLYEVMTRTGADAVKKLENFEKELDRILLDLHDDSEEQNGAENR